MGKPLLFLAMILVFTPGLLHAWSGVTVCGVYEAKGIARSTAKGLILLINEKTQSELQVSVPIQNEPILAPHVNKAMKAKVQITKSFSGNIITGTVQEIESRIPNPLDPQDTGIKLLSKVECQK